MVADPLRQYCLGQCCLSSHARGSYEVYSLPKSLWSPVLGASVFLCPGVVLYTGKAFTPSAAVVLYFDLLGLLNDSPHYCQESFKSTPQWRRRRKGGTEIACVSDSALCPQLVLSLLCLVLSLFCCECAAPSSLSDSFCNWRFSPTLYTSLIFFK